MGGIITFLLFVIVGSVMVDFLVSTFFKRRHLLDISGTPLDGYVEDPDGRFYPNHTLYPGQDSRKIYVKDLQEVFGNYFTLILFNASDCS